ncbi:MAG: FG-GAP-like repeat-containing protein [Terriglobia bacterium]
MVRKSVLEVHSSLFSSLVILASLFAAYVLWTPCATAQNYVYGVTSYPVGNGPDAVVAADFNHDGQLDIAVANSGDNTVTVFLSQPNGTLAAGVTYDVENYPNAIVAADFNGDGYPDLAVLNENADNVSVLINNGDGTFQGAVNYQVGATPFAIVAADFNGDQKMDLAVTNFRDNTVSVLLGNGDGTFQTQVVTQVGNAPVALATGDLDNDGKPDLVVAYGFESYVTALLSNGDGTFTRKDSPSGPGAPSSLSVGDFNNDGNLDVVVVYGLSKGNSGATLLGNGDGTFRGPILLPSGAGGISQGAADINHDGKLDLVVSQQEGGTFVTLFGNGDGTFQNPITAYVAANDTGPAMVLADLNGDGQPDLVTVVNSTAPRVNVLLGNPSGIFSNAEGVSLGVDLTPAAAVAADFNGDGKPDVAVELNPSQNQQGSGAIAVLLSNGDGTFQPAKVTNLTSSNITTLVAGDFNGDGKMDLAGATGIFGGPSLSVFLGNGDGTFQPAVITNLPYSPAPMASGDFNGDGKTDLATSTLDRNNDFAIRIDLSNGDGTFTPGAVYDIGQSLISAVAASDLNNDGKLDLVVASGSTVYVFLGLGGGLFTEVMPPNSLNFQPEAMAVADFNGDGIPDVAVAGQGQIAILLGNGNGTFQAPQYTEAGIDFPTLLAGDFDHDGKMDLIGGGSGAATLFLGNASGGFAVSSAFNEGGPLVTEDFNSDGTPDLAIAGALVGAPSNNASTVVLLSAPTANLAPSPLNFGQVSVGQSGPPQEVTLTNLGTVPMSNFGFSTTGDFSQTNTCTSSLSVSAQCQIDVTFTPTAPGLRSGSVVIADTALPNPQVVGLSGTGEASSVSFSPTNLNFNVQEVGTNSAPQTVTLTNTGNQPLVVTSVTASAKYSETNTCIATPIQPNAKCTITVTFSPTAPGPLNGTITVTDNANNQAGSQQTVPLSGTGSTTAVYLSTGSLAFGSQSIGTVSPPQPVTLTNVGTTPVTISSITASANFSETNNCNAPLRAGGFCTVEVSFAPAAPGTLNGTLTVAFNAPGSPETVALSGTGTGPVASLSATSVTFPGQLVDTRSVASHVTLTNTGTTPLTITSIATTGDYSENNRCPKTLNVNQNCVINVAFTPTQGGTRTGTMNITDNAKGSPQKVALTGTGQDFTLAIASGSSTSQSVSPGGTATYMLDTSGLGGLKATVSFTCAGAPAKSTCSVSPTTSTPGSTATAVTVTVTTQAASMAGPWFEETLRPLNGTNTKLMLLALVGMLLLLAGLWLGGHEKPTAARLFTQKRACRGYRIRLIALPALLLLLALGVAACGGGNGMGSQTIPGTAAGTYNLTLTGTATVNSQVLMHNVPLTLIVK